MASESDITSTEKLLHVIRGGEPPEDVSRGLPATEPAGTFSRFTPQKGLSIGIDIGYSHIRFVKVKPASHRHWRLVDYAAVFIPEDCRKGTPGFSAFLKDTLAGYCGPATKINLWAMMSAASVEVRNISVPRVGKKELRNVVLWSAKKELDFNEEDAVFDFEVQGDVIESGVEKLGILFYTVPRKEVDETSELFAVAGYPLSGLTVAPLSLQNIFRTDWIPALKRTVASLYIGRGWSRIDIFSDGNLVLTRGIKAGFNSMAESLVDEYATSRKQLKAQQKSHAVIPDRGDAVLELSPAQSPVQEIMELDQARKLVQALSPDSTPETDLMAAFGLSNDDIFQLILPALERLVRQVERTFEHYTVNMGRESITAIYLSMAMNVYQPTVDYIGSQLGIESDILDPLNPDHAWVEGQTSEETISERSAFVPVLGVALSHSSKTLNLIFTREDKKKRRRYLAANYAVMAVFCVLMAGALGWYSWLDRNVTERNNRIAILEQMWAHAMHVNEMTLMKMTADVKAQGETIARTRERYFAAALFGEVAAVTPPAIKILSVRADLGAPAGGGRVSRSMLLEGFVTGNADSLDADLIAYVMNLQSSPIFDRVVINTKNIESLEGADVLRFALAASITGVSL